MFSKTLRWSLITVLLSILFPRLAAEEAKDKVTIRSDQLELLDRGARTIFSGHVVLTHGSHVLEANRMTQVSATEVVTAEGNIWGNWNTAEGEKIIAEGQYARYDPRSEQTELWGKARIRRWENKKDRVPVEVRADRFIYKHQDETLFAKANVRLDKTGQIHATSDEAKWVRALETVYLWSQKQPVEMDWTDEKGSAHFVSEEAELYLNPKRIRLLGTVKGRVTPEGSL